MLCETCQKDFPITKLTFIEAGRVPGLIMERRKAQCKECMMGRDEYRVRDQVYDGPGEPPLEEDDAPF